MDKNDVKYIVGYFTNELTFKQVALTSTKEEAEEFIEHSSSHRYEYHIYKKERE